MIKEQGSLSTSPVVENVTCPALAQKHPHRNSPLHKDAVHESAWKHVTGTALFVDDMPNPPALLLGHIVGSPVAHGKIRKINLEAAKAVPGIVAVLSAKDIPGHNDISAIFHDEELLASQEVFCVGQAIALILGESYEACHEAARRVELDIEPLEAVFDTKEAVLKGSLFSGCHVIERGDLDAAFASAALVLEGELCSPAQEHWYLETQCSQAELNEDNDVIIYSSTQNPRETQAKAAEVLGIGENRVVVEMPRMGGGFGGKETQANPYAALAALGAWHTRRPVRVWLDRDQDSILTGKRHPFYSKYRAAFDIHGHILGFDVQSYANGGWALDLSRSILDRCLFHLDGCYYIPALRFEGRVAKTNLTSNTAFRGFGGPQGFFVIEQAMARAARRLKLDLLEIRRRNYYGPAPRNVMQYGAELQDFRIPQMTESLVNSAKYYERLEAIDRFNQSQRFVKRGLGFMPVKFGISFTNTMLNQGGALVLIYTDGTVAINHGGAEMGQGLHSKMLAIAAHDLGIKREKIRIKNTRTDKVPNSSATAASSGTDLNGAAISDACLQLNARLRRVAAEEQGLSSAEADKILFDNGLCILPDQRRLPIEEIIQAAYRRRISLSAVGFYATPGISYDASKGQGRPFAYYAYGVCIVEIEVSTLTGEYCLREVDILHDVGDAILPNIDKGQVEGAFVQGFGWLSTEELLWSKEGVLLTPNPATYKIPTLGSVPESAKFRVRLLENASANAIHGSKAVGEPPFVLALALVHALEHAISACGPAGKDPQLRLPATPEAVLRAIVEQGQA